MPTLNPSDIALNQTCITGQRKIAVIVDALRVNHKIDPETKQRTTEPDKYIVDIVARNRVQSVKLPLDAITDETYKKITEALASEKIVKINFGATASTLRGKFYALINKSTGQLVQGISCTASELNLVSIDEPELDDIDEDFINL